jgi:hypothetical protein
MSYHDNEMARALRDIAFSLQGIRKALDEINEKTITPFRDVEARKAVREKKSPGMCSIFETECYVCERWTGRPCMYLVRNAEERTEGVGNG